MVLLWPNVSTAQHPLPRVDLLNGVSLTLAQDGNGQFLGIGAIATDDRPLTDPDRPLTIEIVGRDDRYNVWAAPEPFHYTRQEIAGVKTENQVTTITVNLQHEDGTVDTLGIHIKTADESFHDTPARGFRYWFSWSSPVRYAHQIRETSWWTFGESVAGLRWISQNSGYGRGACDFLVDNSEPFGGRTGPANVEQTDNRLATGDVPPENPITFAYLDQKESRETRQGDGDYLTFASREDVSFLRYADTVTQNYWQFERPRGDKAVRFEEWYGMPLARTVQSAPMVVQVMEMGGLNAWIAAREHVRAKLLENAGFPDRDPVPWVAYTQYPIDDPADHAKQIPFDEALALMTASGIKEYWWYGPWQSNWSERERMTAEEIERHGLFGHAVWDYDWARNKYDIEGMTDFAKESAANGIQPVIWLTQTMSQISPHVQAHPDWALRRHNGSLFNYVYPDLVGMNHASGYSDFLVDRVTRRRADVPFQRLWLDSFFFSADKLNEMDPQLAPNFPAAVETVRKLVASGIERVYVEQCSPIFLPSPTGILPKAKAESGEQTHLLYHTASCHHLDLTPAIYFQNLAFKSCPMLYLRSYRDRPEFQQQAAYVNKAYVKALPEMRACSVLTDGMGTLWWNDTRTTATVFAFKSGTVNLDAPITAAREVLSETPQPFDGDALTVDAFKVYRVDIGESGTPKL